LLAAGGFLPLPLDEMMLLLVHLASDPDSEIAAKAAATLDSWSKPEIVSQLKSPQCRPEVLEYFASSAVTSVQEAIILNPEVSDSVVAALAAHVSAPLLEIILYNRMRLLEHPEILRSIRNNPAATQQILGQVREIETEFFSGKQRSYTTSAPEEIPPIEKELIQLEGELSPEDLALEGLPVDPEEREAAILRRLASMTVRQKIHLALMGNKEARAILVRDSNKEITRSVLQSPKLTVIEVEAFAAMRQISEDVLRHIGNSKTWTKSYAVVHNLVRNPKTPPMISQRLLNRLLPKDVTMLSRDRGVSEAVRRNAERMMKQRSANKPTH
jgi:hypothetical protein